MPVPVFGYLGVHHEILNFNLAQSIDGVGYPAQECRYITLVLTGRVGLTEVLHGPRCSLAHPSSLPPEPPSSATRAWSAVLHVSESGGGQARTWECVAG